MPMRYLVNMNFIDRAEISDGTLRKTSDGYVVAEVPVARTGVQDYAGREVGKPDMARVRVYRPAEEVFADAHLISIAHRPVTNDHPSEAVTPATWKRDSVGFMGGEIRKDEAAGLIHVPLLFADAAAISDLERGKREVSMGYTCDLDWTAGVTADGESFDAVQRNIRANHCALVNKGRAGYSCRVGDNWTPIDDTLKEPSVAVKTITHDGVPVEVTDAAEAIINKLITARDALKSELTDAQAAEAKAVEAIEAKDGEITVLNKQLADAVVTPEKLAKLVADRSKLIADAKSVDPEADENDSDADMKRKAVKKKVGDSADTMSDAAIDGAFAVLVNSTPTTDAFRETVKDGVKTNDVDKIVSDARTEMLNRLFNPLPLKADA